MTILIQQRWRILCYWQLECGFFLFLWTLEKHWHVWKGSEFWKEKTRCRHNNASHLSRCLIFALAAPLHWSSLAPTLTFAMFHPQTPPMYLSDTHCYQEKGSCPTSVYFHLLLDLGLVILPYPVCSPVFSDDFFPSFSFPAFLPSFLISILPSFYPLCLYILISGLMKRKQTQDTAGSQLTGSDINTEESQMSVCKLNLCMRCLWYKLIIVIQCNNKG